MRDLFPTHYKQKEQDFDALLRDCVFVFDTSALLNIYTYQPVTQNDVLDVLDAVKDRLWIPYQVADEYHAKLHEIISRPFGPYDNTIQALSNFIEQLAQLGNGMPSADIAALVAILEEPIEQVRKAVESARQRHRETLKPDERKDKIADLFAERVGPRYSAERLAAVCQLGGLRYENEMPPGFRDKNKRGMEQFGDLVVWFQILDYAREQKRPIVLVTDDEKQDWWEKDGKKKLGPHSMLKQEMMREAGVEFYAYSLGNFAIYVGKLFNRPLSEEAVEDLAAHEQAASDERAVEEAIETALEVTGIAEDQRQQNLGEEPPRKRSTSWPPNALEAILEHTRRLSGPSVRDQALQEAMREAIRINQEHQNTRLSEVARFIAEQDNRHAINGIRNMPHLQGAMEALRNAGGPTKAFQQTSIPPADREMDAERVREDTPEGESTETNDGPPPEMDDEA
jgi:hypothetical protein